MTEHYDLVGVGVGPANLALAVAVQERNGEHGSRPLRARFFDRSARLQWHPGMLLEESSMMDSFVEDLVCTRNPTSPYTFLNYLAEHDRLLAFVARQRLRPSRAEFTGYLQWVARELSACLEFEADVVGLEPASAGTQLEVRVARGTGMRSITTSALCVATGGVPRLPTGIETSLRIFHSSRFVPGYETARREHTGAPRVLVVGGGQSGAEICAHLLRHDPAARVSLALGQLTLRPTDESHYAFGVFQGRHYLERSRGLGPDRRRALAAQWKDYGLADPETIESLYEAHYARRVAGDDDAFRILGGMHVRAAIEGDREVEVILEDQIAGGTRHEVFDIVVFATGYRRDLPAPLRELHPFIPGAEDGTWEVTEDHRLRTRGLQVPIYMQGFSESVHGPGDALIPSLPHRTGAIAERLARHTRPQRGTVRVNGSHGADARAQPHGATRP